MRKSSFTATWPVLALLTACAGGGGDAAGNAAAGSSVAAGVESAIPASTGQAAMVDTVSTPSIAKIAAGSKDHTTLMVALQAANLVDVLATPGPFTVFAPTNDAFGKLPAGTVDVLLKPENKEKLTEILQHHVTTSAFDLDAFSDGQDVSMVSAGTERITKKDGATYIGGAKVIASVRAGNGWVHITDAVLVPVSPK